MINLLRLLWGALLAAGLSISVLVLAVASRLAIRNRNANRRVAARARLWPLATAVVVLACLSVIAAIAASSGTGDIYNYYYAIDYERAVGDYNRVLRLPGAAHTSVCSHRMLAANHGWNPGVFVDIMTAFGMQSEPDCGGASPGL